VRGPQIEIRSYRNDPGRINAQVALIVVLRDVTEIACLCHAGMLIKITQVARKVFIVGDAPPVALEMAGVNGVKAQECQSASKIDRGSQLHAETHSSSNRSDDRPKYRLNFETALI